MSFSHFTPTYHTLSTPLPSPSPKSHPPTTADLTASIAGIYGVGKAAAHPPAMVVMSYRPEGATTTIAWVGKGTFLHKSTELQSGQGCGPWPLDTNYCTPLIPSDPPFFYSLGNNL